MGRFRTRDYTFFIEVAVRCRFSESAARAIAPAVKATLLSLPALALKPLRRNATYGLTVSVVSSPTIRELNREYRGKDRPTDVLAFSQLDTDVPFEDPRPEIGEVMLCGSVARAQAEEYGTTLSGETQRLVVHGVLHLFGYDHERSPAEERRMFRLQDKILAGLRLRRR